MSSGVYRIEIGDSFYYGSSKDIDGRRRRHLSHLRTGKHGNSRMQNAWNKYGEWTFKTIEICPIESILMVEQSYLDRHFGHERCMNLVATAGSPLGYRHTPEAIAKMRVPKPPEQVARLYGNTYASALKGTKMSSEAIETNRRSHTGLKQSDETRRKRSEAWVQKRADGYISPNKGRQRGPST